MTLHMLGDLGSFLLMIIYFLVAFSCAFIVLLYHSHGNYVKVFEGSKAWTVFESLWVAQLNAEPATFTDHSTELDATYEEHSTWVGFLLMAGFGFVVAILLLNLLIAVFAKTVDQVCCEEAKPLLSDSTPAEFIERCLNPCAAGH